MKQTLLRVGAVFILKDFERHIRSGQAKVDAPRPCAGDIRSLLEVGSREVAFRRNRNATEMADVEVGEPAPIACHQICVEVADALDHCGRWK
jgi:hypothetical protein